MMTFKNLFLLSILFCLGLFSLSMDDGILEAEPLDNQPPANIIFNSAPLLESYASGTGFAEFRLIDADNDTGTFSLVFGDGDDDNESFRIQSGTFLVVNSRLDYETKPSMRIRVRGTDPGGLFVERTYTINVVDENEAPEFTSTAPTAVDANSTYLYSVTVQDPDQGDAVANLEVTMAPSWLSLTTVTPGQAYTLSGRPSVADIGMHEVRLKASDGAGLARTQLFFITVNEEGTTVDLDSYIYLPLVVRN